LAYRLEPDEAIDQGLRRVARERLDAAIRRLDDLEGASAEEVEKAVHDVRKRNKELRALLQLVRPEVGGRAYHRADRRVRDASRLLASVRDAQAQQATFQDLRAAEGDDGHDAAIDAVAAALEVRAESSSRSVGDGAPNVVRARKKLAKVRQEAEQWSLPADIDALARSIGATYGKARRTLAKARKDPVDERLHEWRKRVKQLWYQVRLVETTAPSVLGPLVDRLDDLSDALGDEHDLSALLAALKADPAAHGGKVAVRRAAQLIRHRRSDLRDRAFGLGARLLAEDPKAFGNRIAAYWRIDREQGREPKAGSIADLADLDERPDQDSTVERERKFLVARRPPLNGSGRRIRQGYVAIDGKAAARVRDQTGVGATLTIKGGSGPTRTELEWPLDRVQFDALWPLAEGRCVEKTRHRVPVGPHTAEVDVFGGALEGLWLVEVEFDSEEDLARFEPPPWFGPEVTDDLRYTNAHLAAYGWEARFDDLTD
jgi:CYTH domain-containing protein/CHAD domain-containing protein